MLIPAHSFGVLTEEATERNSLWFRGDHGWDSGIARIRESSWKLPLEQGGKRDPRVLLEEPLSHQGNFP